MFWGQVQGRVTNGTLRLRMMEESRMNPSVCPGLRHGDEKLLQEKVLLAGSRDRALKCFWNNQARSPETTNLWRGEC